MRDILWFSGDSILKLSGLLNAGLIRIHSERGIRTGSLVQLTLTPKGRMVVEAWRAGDEEMFRKALDTEA